MLRQKADNVHPPFGVHHVALRLLLRLPLSFTEHGHFLFIGEIDLVNHLSFAHAAKQGHTPTDGSLTHDDPFSIFACPVRKFELAIHTASHGKDGISVMKLRCFYLMMPPVLLILLSGEGFVEEVLAMGV